ncbi:DUF2459 domain-containing protein [Altererythrobacter sp. CAU 1778]
MAAAARYLGRFAAWLALVVGLFMAAAWIGSSIPRNADWQEKEPQDPQAVTILIETNGIHTGIVMPLVTPQKDWRDTFPASDLPAPTRPYTHVSVSWGEREVFLNTPSWWDLSPAKAIRAATGGDGLLHAAHYVRPAPADDTRPMRISGQQYARLVRAIERQVPTGPARRVYPGYASYDVFYDAPGTYHLGNTCNQWVSDTLAGAGIRTGWWTPFPGGVMKWVPPLGGD